MTEKTPEQVEAARSERIRLLAESLHEANKGGGDPGASGVHAPGLIGGNYIWGLVASRLITMMEEVAREAVDQYLNPPKK